jgi:hypothetical protein
VGQTFAVYHVMLDQKQFCNSLGFRKLGISLLAGLCKIGAASRDWLSGIPLHMLTLNGMAHMLFNVFGFSGRSLPKVPQCQM